MKTAFTILVILCLQQVNTALGQNACIDFYPIGDIISMAEDSSFLWIGSEDKGLIQFDKSTGTSQYFDTSNSNIPNQVIQSTLFHNGKLYVSTNNSLLTFENNSFTIVNDTIDGLLLEDTNGDLAVIDKEEIHILQNDNIIYYQDFDLIPGVTNDCCSFSTDAIIDASGNLWISRFGFYEFDILKFDGAAWQSFNYHNTANIPIESYQHNGIANVGNTIYATVWDNLLQYEQGIWHPPLSKNDIVNGADTLHHQSSINAIDVDASGMIWLGAGSSFTGNEAGEVLYFDNNQWHFLPVFDTIRSTIQKIHFSTSNPNIVYAASTTGLAIINKFCLSVSNEKQILEASEMLKVFPNPATEQITIELNHKIRKAQLTVMDMQGKIIFQKNIHETINTLDVSHWAKGVYFISLTSENLRQTKSLVIY